MPNNLSVGFKLGSQEALTELLHGSGDRFKAGSFYLTNDTDRLYFAQSASELVPLNQFIRIIPSATGSNGLPSTAESGDIYYIQDQNILAIYDSDDRSWTQLNPDTRLVESSSAMGIQAINDETNNIHGVKIKTSVSDTKNNIAQGAVDLVEGNENIHIVYENGKIKISSDNSTTDHTYTLNGIADTAKGIIRFHDVLANSDKDINIVGSNSVSVKTEKVNNVDTITITGNARVTSTALAIDQNGEFKASASTVDGSPEAGNITGVTPTIAYGFNGTSSTTGAIFAGGTAVLSVYTKDEVDAAISQAQAGFDAMTYLGTISSASALSTTANVGDTYKATASFEYGSDAVKPGDLLIAHGEDGNVTWEVVPSGNDQAISGSVAGGNIASIAIIDNSTTLAQYNLTSANSANKANIIVAGTVNGAVNNVTLEHGAPPAATTSNNVSWPESATAQTAKSSIQIPTIIGMHKDAAGHIIDVTTGLYEVVDTHNYINIIKNGATAVTGANAVAVAHVISEADGDSKSATFTVTTADANSNIKITTTSNDSDPTIQIDLVWGSF